MPGNEEFARYVTSTAFSLSLSGQMIAGLDHLAVCQQVGTWQIGPPPGWTSACSALLRRGLAYREANELNERWGGPMRISEAGRLVHQLCIMAGLVPALDSPARKVA